MTRFLLPIFASAATVLPVAAATQVLQSFEGDGFNDWKVEGTAFGLAPAAGTTDGINGEIRGYAQDALAISAHGGDVATGSLTSPEFTLSEPYITFLIAGGDYAGKTAAQLVIDGKVVREATGQRDLECRIALWDVKEFAGQKANFRLIDDERGAWGFIAADHILMTDYPNQKFPATTRSGKSHVAGLVEAEGLAGVTIPQGSKLTVAAGREQEVISPTALAFDEKGDLFISETHRFRFGVEDNRDNLYWYFDDLAAQTVEDRRALHEKWKDKVSIERLTEKSEVIRRLAAPDANGFFQESTVFADGFNDVLDGTGAGVFVYEGTLYFASIPKLWMLRDTTGDGKADLREVVEGGFGVRISLSGHDLNGFALGPDGRVYGTIGDRGFSLTTKEGKEYHYPNEGAAFRFEPDGTGFEVFHTGLRNPKEIAFDAWGNAFSVDNDSDQGDAARIVYLVEGGDSGWQMEHQAMHTFHRQIGLEERPPSRWMDEKMWEPENAAQPAFILPPAAALTSGPSGLTVHPGTGFLESEDGRFLICDYRGGAANSGIWSFAMEHQGAGMKMTDSRRFTWGVAATDVEYSWDGRVFITDFISGWKSHDDGRVLALDAGTDAWRATEAADAAKLIAEGFDQRDSGELATLLKHLDARVRLRAQIALSRKSDALDRFSAASASADEMERLHGIWGLGILARRGNGVPLPVQGEFARLPEERVKSGATAKLVELFKHDAAEVRAQALRSIADSGVAGDALPLSPLLFDESPRVQFFAAIAAGKLKALGLYGPICDFLERNDNADRHLRHAGIYALEHLTTDPGQLTGLATHESAAVRLAAAVALRRQHSPAVVSFLPDADPRVSEEAIRAITDLSLDEVRRDLSAQLDDLSSREWSPFTLRRLIHNEFRLGTPESANRLLQVAANDQLPEIVRKEAFRLLASWAEPHPVDQLTGHWRPLEKRDASAIQGVLAAAMPALLRSEGFVLAEALGLIDRYDIDIDGLDNDALMLLAQNANLPPVGRAKALELLIERQPEGLAATLARIAADPADEVALAALAGMAAVSPEAALPALESTISGDNSGRAKRAWGILSKVPGEEAAGLFLANLNSLAAAKGVSPYALELMEAARARPEEEVRSALAAFEAALAEAEDPLAKWLPALQGGDPVAGAALFAAHPTGQCMRCHNAEEGQPAGAGAGPSLAGIAKRQDRRYLLESMVAPSAVITPGFGLVGLTLNNGASLGGNLIAETEEHLDLDLTGKLVRVMRADVESQTAPVSSMPPMESLLSLGEMRDLVAWLATLEDGNAPGVAAGEPEVLDPATLLNPPAEEIPAPAVPEEAPMKEEADPADEAAAPADGEASARVAQEMIPVSQEVVLVQDETPATAEIQSEPAAPAEVAASEAQAAATEPAPAPTPEPAPEPAPALASAAGGLDPEVKKAGQAQYIMCAACHGQNGEGSVAGPPLAGSEWVNGPEENLIRIQLRGLVGPITVKGQEYNFPAGMIAMAFQTDEQVASVLTFIRNSFGNKAPAVAPGSVAAFRGEVGQPPLTQADLVSPFPAPATESPPAPASVGADLALTTPAVPALTAPPRSTKYDNLSPGLGIPGWVITLIVVFIIVSLFPLFARNNS